MINIENIKEKIDMNNTSSTTADLRNKNKMISDVFSKFPICNNDQLENITNTINDQNIEQLVIKIYFIYNVNMIITYKMRVPNNKMQFIFFKYRYIC